MYGTSVIINNRGVKIAHRVYETVTVERTPNLAAQWGAEDAQQGISKRGLDYFADPDILNVYVSAYNATQADVRKDRENYLLWKWTEIYFRQKALGATIDTACAIADYEMGRVWSGSPELYDYWQQQQHTVQDEQWYTAIEFGEVPADFADALEIERRYQ